MIEGIPVDPQGIGLVGAVLLFGIGLATGRIFVRRQYDEKAHEANEWRTESRIKDAQIAELNRQLRTVEDLAKLVRATMRAIQRGPKDGVP